MMNSIKECGYYEAYGFEIDTCTFEWNWRFINGGLYVNIIICLIYGLLVELLKKWVKNQKNYIEPKWMISIRPIHNLSLSLVSFFMFAIQLYIMIIDGRFKSWHTMACQNTLNAGLFGFINFCYLLTKIWEWMDTFLLVLSNKNVIFLHYFHHMTTFTMAAVVHNFPVGGYCFFNCIVHFIMYLHYYNPVKFARPFITAGQLLQFVAVISIHSYGFLNSKTCYNMEPVFKEWLYCQGVVCGYFFLFLNFAFQQYIRKSKKKKSI